MVRQGDFTVQLVDAETNEPFQEHVKPSDGSHYVEVEPNAEYWIRIESHANHPCRCIFEVDGSSLGLALNIKAGERPHRVGIWSRIGLTSTYQALKIKAIMRDKKGDEDYNGQQQQEQDRVKNPFAIGTVQVQIYQAIPSGIKKFNDSERVWKASKLSSKDPCGSGSAKGKKAVVSSPGTKVKSSVSSQNKPSYKQGKLLEIINLRYCTAAGLIYNDVLPKPAARKDHQLLDSNVMATNNASSLESALDLDDDDDDDDMVVFAADPILSRLDVQAEKNACAIDLTNIDDRVQDFDDDDVVVIVDNVSNDKVGSSKADGLNDDEDDVEVVVVDNVSANRVGSTEGERIVRPVAAMSENSKRLATQQDDSNIQSSFLC